MEPMIAYIGLGSNLGDREASLRAGLGGLTRRRLALEAVSSIWETEPVGLAKGAAWFLNMAARIETAHGPLEVLDALHEIEREAGRERHARHAPRVLDLDLLLLGDLVLDHPRLTLPHPRMWERRFVLAPLAEIASDLRDPLTRVTIAEALERLQDPHRVRRVGPIALPGSTSL